MLQEYLDFTGFDWDKGNRDKSLKKHGVHGWECEQVFFNSPLIILEDEKHSAKEKRYAAFGHTDSGKQLMVVYTMRRKLLRVISARNMNRKEREFYENF
ncbi:MAG: BrnT family toxin [Verrucomicrobia bacterium]|nr:BrnT family toxin [Verrucomicrobiota bacterium]